MHNEGAGTPISLETATRWIAAHQHAARPLWLASAQDAPVAWLSFLGFSDRPGCASTAELGVHVRESWRGRGVARQLLGRAVRAAPSLGFDRLLAFIREDNEASLAVFRSHGFESWGCLPGVMRSMGSRCALLVLGREVNAAKAWYA